MTENNWMRDKNTKNNQKLPSGEKKTKNNWKGAKKKHWRRGEKRKNNRKQEGNKTKNNWERKTYDKEEKLQIPNIKINKNW